MTASERSAAHLVLSGSCPSASPPVPPAPAEWSAVETRLDLYPEAAGTPACGPPVIYTCRRVRDGGRFAGGEADRAALLARALAACRLQDRLDVEWDGGFRDWPDRHPESGFILSYHNLETTPPDLSAIFNAMAAVPAGEFKIVTTVRSWRDVVALRRLLQDARRRGLALTAFGCGPLGPASRLLALAWGTHRLYLAADTPLVPGMLTAAEFFGVYRAERVTANCRIFGVVGDPVSRSRSPFLHNWFLARRGRTDLYIPFPAPDPADFLTALPDLDPAGLSVTVPHKGRFGALCVARSSEAARIGAVNTLTRHADGWRGDNTDWSGFRDSTAGFLPVRGGPVLVLGAGGSARAVLFALEQAGISTCVWNRSPDRLRQVLADFPPAQPWAATAGRMAAAVINTTPADAGLGLDGPGLGGHPPVPVFDLNYGIPPSRFLSEAAARGWPVRDGSSMLFHQALAQHRLWTGGEPPVSWTEARELLAREYATAVSDTPP